jgi:hypothetical protein
MTRKLPWFFLVLFLWGCDLPYPATPPLTAAQARHTLDHWNPQYCKVVEFYGLHQTAAHTRLAYVLLGNPKASGKPVPYVAQFQLLTRQDGKEEWFLTSLMNHSAGLTRRQGWDNLMAPLKTAP